MATILGELLNRAPVPLAPTRRALTSGGLNLAGTGGAQQLETYKALSTLYKVVSKRASSVAMTEWGLWRGDRDSMTPVSERDPRDRVTSHLALDVWGKPNPHTKATYFRRRWSMHMDLVGEAYILPATRTGMAGAPTELWQTRPDRMTPIPDPTEYLAGWEHRSPDGKVQRLDTDQVWQFMDPDPSDPYRGIAPIQALMTDIEGGLAAAKWNRTFFLNGCELGGVIEAVEGMTDDEFDRIAQQMEERHQGVANAHRWMVVEHGKVVPFEANHKDMQFADLRNLTRDLVREAYAMPKVLLGIGESVNRATAEAAWAIYLSQEIRMRLEELRDWLNHEYLPRFGRTANGLSFDFIDPIPEDAEAANAELLAKSEAAAKLVDAGYDPVGVLETVGLPAMDHTTPAGPGAPAMTAGPPLAQLGVGARNAADIPPDQLPNISRLQKTFDGALARLEAQWTTIEDDQKDELVDQVQAIVQAGEVERLNGLQVDTTAAAALLVLFMTEMSEDGAAAVVGEAKDQGVQAEPAQPDQRNTIDVARVVATLIAGRLIDSAKSTAMRANSTAATGPEVADEVRAGLAGLSEAGPRPRLAGALTGAQNDGRLATIQRAPVANVYASEVNDSNTCGPCNRINGTWLGTSDQMDEILASYPGGAFGGYKNCDGRERCRGTVVAVWGPVDT